jgi:two-component system phosphate regulon sensor histidine kinase PhoR
VLTRFFWRLYVTYVLLVVVTAVVIGLLIEVPLRQQMDRDIERGLFDEAIVLAPSARGILSDGSIGADDATFRTIEARTGTRITLIRPDGVVVGDSSEEAAAMENHGERPEFLEAMASGRGVARRFSETTQTQRLYAALRIESGGATLGVARTSVTLADVSEQLGRLRTRVVQGALLGIVLALGIGLVVARRVTAPIAEMTAVSEALRRGEYDARADVTRSDEIGTLAENMNQLGDELGRRLARLSRQQAQFNAFLGAMQEGVIAIDEHDRVVFSNAMGRRLMHLGAERREIETAQLPPNLLDILTEVRSLGTRARAEIIQTIDDEELVLDARGAPFTAEETSGVVLVLYDVTNMRRLERVRTDFVANVSHELKTPLTSLQGYVETLLDGAIRDDEHNVRFLRRIEVQAKRLSSLVSDLLSLARIESTALAADAESLDLRDIVMESLARRRDPIADKNLELTVDLPETPLLIEAEAEALRQISDNLIDNAINYTREGGSIEIEARRAEYGAVLRIADTGIGIPENALDRIFERFYRVDRGRSRQLGGTGLGLSIVRNLVERLRGTIQVESELGVGTVFTVVLPHAEEHAKPVQAD